MKDFDYYRKRVAEEDARARKAVGTEAELIHRSLAARYAQMALEALNRAADNDETGPLLRPA